jgi:hypothetical protein
VQAKRALKSRAELATSLGLDADAQAPLLTQLLRR